MGSDDGNKVRAAQEEDTSTIESVDMFESVLSVLMHILTRLIKQAFGKNKELSKADKDVKSIDGLRPANRRALIRGRLARRNR